MMRWIRRRKEGGSWRSDRAPCPFQWSQPVVGVNGSFAAISWNRTDKTSNSGCWRWRPQQHQQHLVDTMTTKRGCHSSDTSPNWNGPSIFIFSSLNFPFLLCVTPPYFFTLGIFIRINFSFLKLIQDQRLCYWSASVTLSELSYRAMSYWPIPWWTTKKPPKMLTAIHYTTWLSQHFASNLPRYQSTSTRPQWAMLRGSWAQGAFSSFR